MQYTKRFTKLEGCGNHFIIFDCISDPKLIKYLDSKRIIQLCRPNFGIGADGVLLLTKAEIMGGQGMPQFKMIVYNADGSLAQMCGNGLRCIVRYLQSDYQLFETQSPVYIQTGAGALEVKLQDSGSAVPKHILQRLIGVKMAWPTTQNWVKRNDRNFEILSLGNPHFVSFDSTDYQLREQRAQEWNQLIPGGINLSFAQQTGPTTVDLHVHERGCGWTLACGTGATAAVFAGYQQQRFYLDQKVEVNLPGGQVTIEIKSDALWLWGPANEVFRGQLV